MGAAASTSSSLWHDNTFGRSDNDLYFCHECHRSYQTQNRANATVCPRCNGNFVEEMMSFNTLTSGQLVQPAFVIRILEFDPETSARRRHSLLYQTLLQHFSESNKPKGLTCCQLHKLRMIKLSQEMITDTPSCPICFEDYEVDGEVAQLPCSHYCHLACIAPWLEAKQNCPVCRYELQENQLKQEDLKHFKDDELRSRLINFDRISSALSSSSSSEQYEKSSRVDLLASLITYYEKDLDKLDSNDYLPLIPASLLQFKATVVPSSNPTVTTDTIQMVTGGRHLGTNVITLNGGGYLRLFAGGGDVSDDEYSDTM